MVLKTKTYFPKADKDIKWYVVDADGQILGRLASQIAHVLRGKNDPRFTPHADLGFRVAVVNAEKVQVTGNKGNRKPIFGIAATRVAINTEPSINRWNSSLRRLSRMLSKGCSRRTASVGN